MTHQKQHAVKQHIYISQFFLYDPSLVETK